MNKKLAFSIIFFSLLFSVSIHAQLIQVNPKFGEVSKAEVEMDTYPLDTTASLLLLYSDRKVSVRVDPAGSLEREIKVRERWKVLKESGKDEIDYEIFYSVANNFTENVREIRATTFDLVDGQVVSHKMSKKFVFDEPYSDGVKRVTFSPENVRLGSVVDVSFIIISPTIDIGKVQLQREYPVNLAEATVSFPDFIFYNTTTLGMLPFSQDRSSVFATLGSTSYSDYYDKLRMADVPALRGEPYSYCPEIYCAAVNYNVRSLNIPGVLYKDYAVTWEDVDNRLVTAGLLDCCKGSAKLIDGAAEAIAGKEDEREKIAAVRNLVMDKVSWNEKVSRLPEKGRTVLKSGSGDSADINALVASVLNSLGYRAEPVMVKLRDNGPMVDYMISMDQYDAMILRIECPSGEVHFLDAAKSDAYVDVLSPSYLVTKARLISNDGQGVWIDLTKELSIKSSVFESVQMRFEDSRLVGSGRIFATGNDSYVMRRKYHSFDDEEKWIEDSEKDMEIRIGGMQFDDPSGYSAQSVVKYDFEKDVTLGDGHIYVNAFLSRYHSDKTFSSEERTLPVDFPYCNSITYNLVFMVPEGYEVESIPQSVRYTCSSPEGSELLLICRQSGNSVTVNYKFKLGSMLVPISGYKDLRTFWEQVCKVEKSMIVLKKI